MRLLISILLAAAPLAVFAGKGGSNSDDMRWNVTGRAWYDTPCGHQGFSVAQGFGRANRSPTAG
jgi:hypothetical protein